VRGLLRVVVAVGGLAWVIDLYLASDGAKFVTGSELVIDGGYAAR
jgi:hypothetical protein